MTTQQQSHEAPAAQPSADSTLVITRTLNAPRELVFKAFTEAERLLEWWGPKGYDMQVISLDMRPGGTFHYYQRSPEGYEAWGIFVYQEVQAPERLTYINSFADSEGNVVRAPFSATWPLRVLSTMSFEEHDGKTTLHMHATPYEASPEEHAAFGGMVPMMNQGWDGTFEQLEAYLARA